MAISKATIKKIAGLLGVKEADFDAAIKAETEVEIEIPEVTVLTAEEISKRDAQNLEEGKKLGKKEGEATAKTLAASELGKKLGITFKSDRIGEMASEIQELMNKGNDEKLAAANEQIKLLTKDKEAIQGKVVELEEKYNSTARDYEIMQEMPKNRRSIFNEREYLASLKSLVEFKDDGVYKGGELMRDTKTQAALPRAEAIKAIFNERKWVEEATPDHGGRGAGDGNPGSGGGKPTTYSKAVEQWKALSPDNTNTISAECLDYVSQVAKDVPQFDYES